MRTGGPDVMEVGMSCPAAGTRIANETGRGSLLAGEAMFEIARDMMRRGAVEDGEGRGICAVMRGGIRVGRGMMEVWEESAGAKMA